MLVVLVAMTILKNFDARDVILGVQGQVPFLERLSFVLFLPFLHIRNHQHLEYERR